MKRQSSTNNDANDDIEGWSGVFTPRLDRVDGRSIRKPHKPREILEKCERRLKLELTKPGGQAIPTLRKPCSELEVGQGFLRYRFAPLIERYEKKRLDQNRRLKREREQFMQRIIQTKLLDHFPSSRYPTQESLAYAVMEMCCVGRRAARGAVKIAIAGLNA